MRWARAGMRVPSRPLSVHLTPVNREGAPEYIPLNYHLVYVEVGSPCMLNAINQRETLNVALGMGPQKVVSKAVLDIT